MVLTLPWPPSINHYWRRVGPRTLISRAYIPTGDWRKVVYWLAAATLTVVVTW